METREEEGIMNSWYCKVTWTFEMYIYLLKLSALCHFPGGVRVAPMPWITGTRAADTGAASGNRDLRPGPRLQSPGLDPGTWWVFSQLKD